MLSEQLPAVWTLMCDRVSVAQRAARTQHQTKWKKKKEVIDVKKYIYLRTNSAALNSHN